MMFTTKQGRTIRYSQARAMLASIDVRLAKTGEGDEMRVYLPGSAKDEGYFTDDLCDAVETGIAMSREAHQKGTGRVYIPCSGEGCIVCGSLTAMIGGLR